MCAQAQQMAGIATHTAAKTARLGKGRNKGHGHLLPWPKGCSTKAASAVLQMLVGQAARPFLFVLCFVLCALQLLAKFLPSPTTQEVRTR